jgi:acetolactate synthase-1/2/3 large subunit
MFSEWKKFVKIVRSDLNYPDKSNKAGLNYVESSSFIFNLMKITSGDEIIIPCSSGAAAYESAMRVISNKGKQLLVTSHALASMGYGLSGAIGAALAYTEKKTIMFEGDGGFAQNLQELGTAVINGLNLKIFIMDNSGYQSIRGNQKNSFAGHYVGCDKTTGLGLPDWEKISIAFGAKTFVVTANTAFSKEFLNLFNNPGLVTFIVKIDPEQTYWPRLMSSINASGNVISNPLHQMDPPLNDSDNLKYLKYI